MKRCTSCGTDNLDRSRFCEQCGSQLPEAVNVAEPQVPAVDPDAEARARADQRERAAAGLPPSFMPPPVQPSFAPGSGWGSNDPVDEPPKKKRRIFLWLIGSVLLLCILVCVGSTLFFNFTDTGKRYFSDFETRAAEVSTEQAIKESMSTTTP